MNTLQAVILAAGKGTRMESDLPKVIHEVMGKTMVHYTINAATKAGASKVVVITGYKGDMVRESIKKDIEAGSLEENVTFAEQTEQLGTGHAVICAKDAMGDEESTLILCGDTPLITEGTIKKLFEMHQKEGNGVTVLSAILEDATGYGRIIRDKKGDFTSIVEQKDCTEEQAKVREINSGMYLFNTAALVDALGKLTNNNAQNEYYLTDTIEIIKKSGLKVNALPVEDNDEILGVNTKVQLAEAERIMQAR